MYLPYTVRVYNRQDQLVDIGLVYTSSDQLAEVEAGRLASRSMDGDECFFTFQIGDNRRLNEFDQYERQQIFQQGVVLSYTDMANPYTRFVVEKVEPLCVHLRGIYTNSKGVDVLSGRTTILHTNAGFQHGWKLETLKSDFVFTEVE